MQSHVSLEELITDYAANLPMQQIAERHGISRQRAWVLLRKAGISRKRRTPGRPRKDINLSEFEEKYRNGMSVEALADYFGVSSDLIRRRCKQAGIKLRGPGPLPKPNKLQG